MSMYGKTHYSIVISLQLKKKKSIQGREAKREGIYVYLRLIHIVVLQKPMQHCKAIILQLKRFFLKNQFKKLHLVKSNFVSKVKTSVFVHFNNHFISLEPDHFDLPEVKLYKCKNHCPKNVISKGITDIIPRAMEL